MNYFEILELDKEKKKIHLKHINLDAYYSWLENPYVAMAQEYHSTLFDQKTRFTTQINSFMRTGNYKDGYQWCLKYLASNEKNYKMQPDYFAVKPKISIDSLPAELISDMKRLGNPERMFIGSVIQNTYNCQISIFYNLAMIFASRGMQ